MARPFILGPDCGTTFFYVQFVAPRQHSRLGGRFSYSVPHVAATFCPRLHSLFILSLSPSLSLFSFFSPPQRRSLSRRRARSLSLPLLSLFSFFSRLRFSGSSIRHFISFLTRDLDLNKPFFDLCCSDSLDPKRTNLVSVSLERSGL